MSDLFLKILNMSISAGWLVLAVVVLRLCLKKAPKWVSVLLWAIVAVRLVCPFSIESVLSLIPSAQTVSPDIMMDPTPQISTGIEPLNNVVNPIISQSFTPEPFASANPLQILIPVAAIIWLAGVALMLIYTAVSYCLLRRKVSTAVLLRDNLFQSENVDSPFVLGIIKPKIYLPFRLDGQSLSHVIAHEQAHIHRKDHWWKPLGFLLLTIHWFNPLMWLAYILLCRDIELACDEKVIGKLDSESKADYTQALVNCSVNRRSIAACPLAFGEVGVKNRVKSVLNYKKPAFWIIVASVAVCAVVAVCFLTDPPQSTVQDIYAQKGYTILEQEPETITLQIPTGNLNKLIYTQEGYQFKPGEVVVWREDSTTIYLSHVQLQNEAPYDYLYFTFGFDYKITDYGSFRSATQINLDSDPPSTSGPVLFVPDNTMFDSAGQIFPDALNERGHNGDGSITLYVSKDACKSARGIMLMDVQLNRIRYAKNGFEDEAAAFFEDLNTGITDLTPNDMVFRADTALQKKIRKELDLPADQKLTYLGEYSVGKNILLWICYETDGATTYVPVGCSLKNSGAYKFKEILRTMTYTTDIVNTVWMGESIYLINNPNCKSIIYKDENGNIVQQIDIGENEHPYVFLMSTPVSPCTCTFADANGEDLQFAPQQSGSLDQQQYLQEVFLGALCEGHMQITSGGNVYIPYVSAAYGDVPLKNPEELKQAGMMEVIPYSDDFAVEFTENGQLDFVIWYDENYQRLPDQWSLDFLATLDPGTYYMEFVFIETRLGGDRHGYSGMFELVVPSSTPALSIPDGVVTLTAEELEAIGEWFAWDMDMAHYPISNSFLTCYYGSLEELSLAEVFGPGCGDNQHGQISDGERKALIERNEFFAEGYDVNRINRDSMDRILRHNTGYGFDDRQWSDLEAFTYLEEYDAYYIVYGGTNWWYYRVIEGYRCLDGSLVLVCEKPNPWMESSYSVLTLRPAENGEGFHGYWFASNLPYTP